MTKERTVFVTLLELLKVEHTRMFANRFFREHPNKDNLLGLSEMLLGYGIENAAIRVADKKTDLFNIELPFVAHLSGFAVVYKLSGKLKQLVDNSDEEGNNLFMLLHFK
jgi:hypothetical protein